MQIPIAAKLHVHAQPVGLLYSLSIKLAATLAQSLGRLFGCDIPLRFRHHFVAYQELAHSGAPQQRRVKVNVEVGSLYFFVGAGQWSLVDAHALGSLVLTDCEKSKWPATYCKESLSRTDCRIVA